jgi:uncharacterized protein YeaO (DUF488 family)
VIKTGCIYSEASEADGLRVLITRYWPRGVKKERADVWLRALGPAADLIKSFKAGAVGWEEFRQSYIEEFKGAEKKEALTELTEIIRERRGAVTLLCVCRDGEKCHTGVLRDMLAAKGGGRER